MLAQYFTNIYNRDARGDLVKYEIQIDHACKEPKVVIHTAEITDEIGILVKKLSEDRASVLSGFKDERIEILEPEELIRIYAHAGRVFAVTQGGEYMLRLRLYEVEERLRHDIFVRISNSEIINLKKVKSFDISFAGTIFIKLANGGSTSVSRRYVAKIKKILGI
jgi:DNA-binding LytR/AlgR family response regulator